MRKPACVCAAVAALAGALIAAAPAVAASVPSDDSGYLAYADRLQQRLDFLWDSREGRYHPGPQATGMNAAMLVAHAVAARRGYHGPIRRDGRARGIVRWLLSAQVWREHPPRGAGVHAHAPGWVSSPHSDGQHLVVDTPPAQALAQAYLARHRLHLPASLIRRIRDHLRRLVRGSYWHWPTLRLNQFSWYAHVFAANAVVNGERRLFARTMERHLRRFAGNAQANFGPGLHFHYLPRSPPTRPINVDSTEYANIVLGYLEDYRAARHAGMPRPPRAARRLLQAWVRRALSGYWTHGGYLNWDTGLGFDRWHQAKKLGLAQEALLGAAVAPEVTPGARWRAWAKDLFDRSLAWYERQADQSDDIPAAVFFGVHVVRQHRYNAYLAASRIEANAARAVVLGLGHRRARRPPALYAFDPDTGRLAVTTSSYSTAVLAVRAGPSPYGGLDLARLMDGRGEVAGNLGGRPPDSFGMVVRRRGGRIACATQLPRARIDPRVTPVRLLHAPAGVGVHASTSARRAYAGRFRRLRARGAAGCGSGRLTSDYTFGIGAIVGRWSLRRRRGAAITVDVLFPSWGRHARLSATLRNGREVPLTGRRLALARTRALHVESDHGRYLVKPLRAPPHAALHALAVHRQPSDPQAGPTAAIQLARAAGDRRVALRCRIVVLEEHA